jgi:hypothetical protein
MTYEDKKARLERIKDVYGYKVLRFETHTDFLIDELEKAWAALEFYAEIGSWEATIYSPSNGVWQPVYAEGDNGKLAREALNEESETEHPGTST